MTETTEDTRGALLVLSELNQEAVSIAEHIQGLMRQARENVPPAAFTAFIQLPRPAELERIRQFARMLTTQPPWTTLPAQDRAYMAEVRCMVDDAVESATILDYPAAMAHARRSLNRMVRVRDRDRADSKQLTKAQEAAFDSALQYLTGVVTLFTDAVKVEKEGGIVA